MINPILNEKRVNEVFLDCFFLPERKKGGAIIKVDSVDKSPSVGFSPERLEKHKNEIELMLSASSYAMKEGFRGQYIKASPFYDATGTQWTESHLRIAQLLQLGMAIGQVRDRRPPGFLGDLVGFGSFFYFSIKRYKGPIHYSFRKVHPVDSLGKGLSEGDFCGKDWVITGKSVCIPKNGGAKDVHIIGFGREVANNELGSLLSAKGQKPCGDGVAFLLGLMAAVPPDKVPRKLRQSKIITTDKSFVLRGGTCYLSVLPCVRYLLTREKPDYWSADDVFLTEDL